MATIDSLVEATIVGDNDLLLIDQGGEGKKLKKGNLKIDAENVLNVNGGSVQDFIDNIDQVHTRTFPNVDAMVNFNGHKLGNTYSVQDYYGGANPNNSGVLFFKVVASGTGAHDGGKYIDINASFQLEQNLKNIVDIKSFGAIGDGVTDSTIMLQSAIYFCGDNGRSMYVPNGDYIHTDTLEFRGNEALLNSGFTVFGDSTAITYSNASILHYQGVARPELIKSIATQMNFKDIIFKTDSRTLYPRHIFLTRNDIETKQDIDAQFYNCWFQNFEKAIVIEGRGLDLYDCNFVLGRHSVEILWPSPFTPPIDKDKQYDTGMRGYTLRGCRFHAQNGFVVINEGYNARWMRGLQISGCMSDTETGVLKGGGIDMDVSSNNFFLGENVIFFNIGDSSLRDSNITGNTFNGIDSPSWNGPSFSVMQALAGSYIDNVNFTGNTVANMSRSCFTIAGDIASLKIADNTFKNILKGNDSGTGRFLLTQNAGGYGNISGVLDFSNNIISGYSRTNNPTTLLDVPLGQIEKLSISGNTVVGNSIPLSRKPYFKAAGKNESFDFTGNGATQIFTMNDDVVSAVIAHRFAGTAEHRGHSYMTINGLSDAGIGMSISGKNITVTGAWNELGASYTVLIIRG